MWVRAEILREGLDSQCGRDHDSFGDGPAWTMYVGRIHESANTFRDPA